jgi:hypothetical protein
MPMVDYSYTASTCDFMYCRQCRHLYYGGENLKYYLTPSPAVLPFYRRAGLTTNLNGTQSAHMERGGGRSRYTIFMSIFMPCCCVGCGLTSRPSWPMWWRGSHRPGTKRRSTSWPADRDVGKTVSCGQQIGMSAKLSRVVSR